MLAFPKKRRNTAALHNVAAIPRWLNKRGLDSWAWLHNTSLAAAETGPRPWEERRPPAATKSHEAIMSESQNTPVISR